MKTWQYEDELEYDRLYALLSWPKAFTLILSTLAPRHYYNTSKLRHVLTVAQLAKRYVQLMRLSGNLLEQRYYSAVANLTGLLHEALYYGADYDMIVATADELVAKTISQLTEDRRQTYAKRHDNYFNQLSNASDIAQAVKLADIQHDSYLLRQQRSKLNKRCYHEQCVYYSSCVQALGQLKNYPNLVTIKQRLLAKLTAKQ